MEIFAWKEKQLCQSGATEYSPCCIMDKTERHIVTYMEPMQNLGRMPTTVKEN